MFQVLTCWGIENCRDTLSSWFQQQPTQFIMHEHGTWWRFSQMFCLDLLKKPCEAHSHNSCIGLYLTHFSQSNLHNDWPRTTPIFIPLQKIPTWEVGKVRKESPLNFISSLWANTNWPSEFTLPEFWNNPSNIDARVVCVRISRAASLWELPPPWCPLMLSAGSKSALPQLRQETFLMD